MMYWSQKLLLPIFAFSLFFYSSKANSLDNNAVRAVAAFLGSYYLLSHTSSTATNPNLIRWTLDKISLLAKDIHSYLKTNESKITFSALIAYVAYEFGHVSFYDWYAALVNSARRAPAIGVFIPAPMGNHTITLT